MIACNYLLSIRMDVFSIHVARHGRTPVMRSDIPHGSLAIRCGNRFEPKRLVEADREPLLRPLLERAVLDRKLVR